MGCEGASVLTPFRFQIERYPSEGAPTRKIDLNPNIRGKYLTSYFFLSLPSLPPSPRQEHLFSSSCQIIFVTQTIKSVQLRISNVHGSWKSLRSNGVFCFLLFLFLGFHWLI